MKSLRSELIYVKFPTETYKCKRELGLVALKCKTSKLSYSCNFPDGSCCKISRDNCYCGHMQYFKRNAVTKEKNIRSLYRKCLLKIQLLCLQDLNNAKFPMFSQARGCAFADDTDPSEQKFHQLGDQSTFGVCVRLPHWCQGRRGTHLCLKWRGKNKPTLSIGTLHKIDLSILSAEAKQIRPTPPG